MKYARLLRSRVSLVVLGFTIVISGFMNTALANEFPPDSQFDYISTNNSVAKPSYLGSYIDPEFNTEVVRITDRANQTGNVHPYPKSQAWNSDMSLLKLGYRIYDPETFIETGITAGLTNGEAYSKLGAPGYDLRWSNVSTNMLYSLDTSFKFKQVIINGTDTTVSLLHDFSGEGYSELYVGNYEGNLDYFDQYVILVGKKPNTSDVFAILYNIQSDIVEWTKVLPHSDWDAAYGAPDNFDWITISPYANHILLSASSKIYQFDINLENEYLLANEAAHGDIGIHQNGNQYYVQFQFSNQGIWGYDLETHQSTKLLPSKYNGGHVSCRNYLRAGWCYINTSKEGHREVFALKLDDSGTVERFAQTHVTISKRGLTQVNVSPDGSKVLFGTDWGDTAAVLDTYQAQMPPIAITNPVPGTTLSGSSETFHWSANGAVSEWWIYAGNTLGSYDYYIGSGYAGAYSANVTGLPTDGSTVYVRMWIKINGIWRSIDETYTADDSDGDSPSITSPLPGSTLSGSNETFSWNTNGTNVSEWWLYAGNTLGGYSYSIVNGNGDTNNTAVTGLPTDGSTVYIRMWFKINGSWVKVDKTYTAINSVQFTDPIPNSTITNTNQHFNWVFNGIYVQNWWFFAGSTVGGYDYGITSGDATLVGAQTTGIPLNGNTVYVRIWFQVDGVWSKVDVEYGT